MLCLGVETSCDETAFALVEDGRLIGEVVSSQIDLHSLFGGVVPEIASREHLRLAWPLLRGLFDGRDQTLSDVEIVAVARGPGLLGSLLVGLGLAKGLALGTGAALVGVNHLHAHLLAPGLERDIPFPALGLLVSGGHTHIYLIRSPENFELLGRTLDDAVGEAFDKVAKLVNLPYPGGRHIDLLGQGVEPDKRLFPRPYVDNDNLDFSFSGVKTAVANYVAARPWLRLDRLPDEGSASSREAHPDLAGLCSSFAYSVVDVLRIKIERALTRTSPVSIIVAGGVAANSTVRRVMAEVAGKHGLPLLLPRLDLCTDNAAMIAYLGERLASAGWRHGLDLEAVARGRPVPWDYVREGGQAGAGC